MIARSGRRAASLALTVLIAAQAGGCAAGFVAGAATATVVGAATRTTAKVATGVVKTTAKVGVAGGRAVIGAGRRDDCFIGDDGRRHCPQ